ncbi:uncharacterized protein [Heliangelus exortis]|uniref:uncharacterized protein isoform X2 n=1 Tax=Heliangelus exortis TaxID=472823 RepID=UPI003A8FA406
MVDTKCSRLPKGSCRVGRKGRIAQKRREAGLTRNLPGDRRNGDGCAGGTRRSPPGLQPPLTDSCGAPAGLELRSGPEELRRPTPDRGRPRSPQRREAKGTGGCCLSDGTSCSSSSLLSPSSSS